MGHTIKGRDDIAKAMAPAQIDAARRPARSIMPVDTRPSWSHASTVDDMIASWCRINCAVMPPTFAGSLARTAAPGNASAVTLKACVARAVLVSASMAWSTYAWEPPSALQ
ncbi:MAG: hypothetical protein IIC06_03190 [Proteobacteria bacterium]|nr:hypothetical protein [Pseudomonadota bacterium]